MLCFSLLKCNILTWCPHLFFMPIYLIQDLDLFFYACICGSWYEGACELGVKLKRTMNVVLVKIIL